MSDVSQLTFELRRLREESQHAEEINNRLVEDAADLERQVERLRKELKVSQQQQKDAQQQQKDIPESSDDSNTYRDHTGDCTTRIAEIREAAADANERLDELINEMATFNILQDLSGES